MCPSLSQKTEFFLTQDIEECVNSTLYTKNLFQEIDNFIYYILEGY